MNKVKMILRRLQTLSVIGWYNISTDMRKRQIGAFLCNLALYFYLLLISVGMIGCNSSKNTIQYVPIDTSEKIITRDSVIIIKDTIQIEVPIEITTNVTTDTVSIIRTSIATSKASIEKGKLHHSLQQSGTLDVTVDTCYITKIEEKVNFKEIPIEITKEVKYIPNWVTYLVLINLGVVAILALRLWIKIKLKLK
jgi:hypothetical protein